MRKALEYIPASMDMKVGGCKLVQRGIVYGGGFLPCNFLFGFFNDVEFGRWRSAAVRVLWHRLTERCISAGWTMMWKSLLTIMPRPTMKRFIGPTSQLRAQSIKSYIRPDSVFHEGFSLLGQSACFDSALQGLQTACDLAADNDAAACSRLAPAAFGSPFCKCLCMWCIEDWRVALTPCYVSPGVNLVRPV